MDKKKTVVIISLALAVITAVIAILLVFGGRGSRVKRCLSMGQKYLDEGDYDEAIAEFERALKLDPLCVDAYIGLADAYIELDDIDEAIKVLNKGIKKLEKADKDKDADILQRKLDDLTLIKQEEVEAYPEEDAGEENPDENMDEYDDSVETEILEEPEEEEEIQVVDLSVLTDLFNIAQYEHMVGELSPGDVHIVESKYIVDNYYMEPGSVADAEVISFFEDNEIYTAKDLVRFFDIKAMVEYYNHESRIGFSEEIELPDGRIVEVHGGNLDSDNNSIRFYFPVGDGEIGLSFNYSHFDDWNTSIVEGEEVNEFTTFDYAISVSRARLEDE